MQAESWVSSAVPLK